MGRLTLGSEELAGDVESLAAHNDQLLAVEQLLGDGAGKATEEVPFGVNHDLCGRVLLVPLCPVSGSSARVYRSCD